MLAVLLIGQVFWPLHMGPLHAVEKWLTFGLAFGPFVLLGLLIWWRGRHEVDPAEDEALGVDETTDSASKV